MLRTSISNKQIHAIACLSKRRVKMVIIGISSYPLESSKEIGKRLGEQPALPAYITLKGPYVSSEVAVGIKTIALYEFDQSKTREALDIVHNRYIKYLGVPGFTYSTHPWLEVKEALKMIGLG
jgi:hypothetical protein